MGHRVVFSAVLAAGLVQMAPAIAQQTGQVADVNGAAREAEPAASGLEPVAVSSAADKLVAAPLAVGAKLREPDLADKDLAVAPAEEVPPGVIDPNRARHGVANVKRPTLPPRIVREAEPALAAADPAPRAGGPGEAGPGRPDVAVAERIVERAQTEHGGDGKPIAARVTAAPAPQPVPTRMPEPEPEMAAADEPSLQSRVDAEIRRERAAAEPAPVARTTPASEPGRIASAPAAEVRAVAPPPAADVAEAGSGPVERVAEAAASLPTAGLPSVDARSGGSGHADEDRVDRVEPAEARLDRRYDDHTERHVDATREPRDDGYGYPRDDAPVFVGKDPDSRPTYHREDRPYYDRRYAMEDGDIDARGYPEPRAEVSWPSRNRYDNRSCDNARAVLLQQRVRREAARGLIDRRSARDIDAEIVHLDDLHRSYCASGMNDWREERLERQFAEIEDRIRYEEDRYGMR